MHYHSFIDGLRAIAVVSVVIYHLNPILLPGGFVGVDIFFVISGFVVASSVANLDRGNFTSFLSHFYIRRLTRIAPALLACLVVTTLVTVFFIPSAWLSLYNSATGLTAFLGLSNMVLMYFSGDYFSPGMEFNPFTHTWSLGIEEQFYFLFPGIAWLWVSSVADRSVQFNRSLFSMKIALLVSAISLFFLAIGGTQNNKFSFFFLPTRLWELGLGVILFLSGQLNLYRHFFDKLSLRVCALNIGIFGICYSLVSTDPRHFPWPGSLAPSISTALIILVLATSSNGLAHRILSNGAAVFLGRRSYSIYLWHWPVLVMFRWTVGLDSIPFQLIAIAIILVLSLASYEFIESPGRSLNKTIRNRGVALNVAGVGIVACMSLSGLIFYFQPSLTFSRTGHRAEWYAEEGYKLFPAHASNCQVVLKRSEYEGGTNLTFTPENCSVPLQQPTLHVAGDSHANAYIGMLRAYADQEAIKVVLYVKAGCSFISLLRTQANESQVCQTFFKNTMAKLNNNIKSGDYLFLPSLRLHRIRDQWGGISAVSNSRNTSSEEDLVDEGTEALGHIASLGASIIFEAPKPVFGMPPFRCSDWFNKRNPICIDGHTSDRSYIENLRLPIISRMNAIQSRVGNVGIWDPLPVLCDSTLCSAYRDNRPLFFDGDHLSGYGNLVLFDSFLAHMHKN